MIQAAVACCILASLFGCKLLSKQSEEETITVQQDIEARDAEIKSLNEQIGMLGNEITALKATNERYKKAIAEAGEESKKAVAVEKELDQVKAQEDAARKRELEKQKQIQKLADGIPEARMIARPEGYFIVLSGKALFNTGSAELKEDAKKALQALAAYLKANPDIKIRIDGHSDSTPIKHTPAPWGLSNHALATGRALAVFHFLSNDMGVKQSQMTVSGLGPNEPIVSPEKNDADKARNRRVEIRFIYPAK